MRVSTRNNMFSVMAHTGFGPVKVFRGGQLVAILEQNMLKKDGTIKRAVAKKLYCY